MLYSFFISIDRRKNSWKPVELHKIGEEFSGCETTISPVSVFLSLPLELFASLSLIFQYGGRPHSPNLHHISSSRSRTNFLIYTWKSALESRIIGSLFAFLKPVHFYLTFCQRYYLYTMILSLFSFFLIIFHFSIHHECDTHVCLDPRVYHRETAIRGGDTNELKWG